MLDGAREAAQALARVTADPDMADRNPEHPVRFVRAITPLLGVTDADATEARAARQLLWMALVQTPSAILSTPLQAPGRPDTTTLGELGVLAALRCAWLSTPVAPRRLSELVAHLQEMRTRFVTEPYSPGLVAAVEQLELQCARALFEYGCDIAFDVPELRTAVPGGWGAAPLAAHLMWPPLLGFHRALILARCMFPANEDLPATNDAAAARLGQWLRARAEALPCSEASPSLRTLLAMHLRPGDWEIYRLVHPMLNASDAAIVGDTLGAGVMASINARMQLTTSRGVLAYADGAEPPEFGLCVHDLMDALTAGLPGVRWSYSFARLAREVAADADEIQRFSRLRPMLIQLFNGWQLAYNDTLFWHNSIVHALTHWLHLLTCDDVGVNDLTWRAARATVFYADLAHTVFP